MLVAVTMCILLLPAVLFSAGPLLEAFSGPVRRGLVGGDRR